jgi:hypothetical protein
LVKSIEATKLHPKTGTSLGKPDVMISFGALIDYVGSDRDREKFTYLGELYACKRETFLSAIGGEKGLPQAERKTAAASEPAPAPAPAKTTRLVWERLNSSEHTVSRARVAGGWLVALNGGSVTFVPDPGRRWDGGSE